MKQTLCISTLAAFAFGPSVAKARLGQNRRVRVAFDMAKSSFSACPGGMVAVQVKTAGGQPVARRDVTLSVGTGAGAKQTKATRRNGYVTFDFSAHQGQLQALRSAGGKDVACAVRVSNPLLPSGFQTVPCPQTIEACCPEGLEPVICQGDMAFASMCEAVKYGMLESECVLQSQYTPDCRLIRGYVKCGGGTMWFPSLCEAQSFGFSASTCEFPAESEVPECAKTGHLLCEGDMEFVNLCQVQNSPVDVANCVYI
jgi:hypothetical protein